MDGEEDGDEDSDEDGDDSEEDSDDDNEEDGDEYHEHHVPNMEGGWGNPFDAYLGRASEPERHRMNQYLQYGGGNQPGSQRVNDSMEDSDDEDDGDYPHQEPVSPEKLVSPEERLFADDTDGKCAVCAKRIRTNGNRCPYAVLGLRCGQYYTERECTKAYRIAARKTHTDKHSCDGEEIKFVNGAIAHIRTELPKNTHHKRMYWGFK